MQFDQYSGKLLSRIDEKNKTAGQRLLDMNYDIHVGAIGGLAGKIIAFIISLFCTSFPVTGFLIWWNKKRKHPVRKILVVKADSVNKSKTGYKKYIMK